jgi:hypothetical protein
MIQQLDSTTVRSGVDWPRLEPIVARFEADCQHRPWPQMDDYLLAGDATDRGALLIELIHSELELRWRAGESVSAREYLERYPELAGNAAVAGELLAREAELRRRTATIAPRRRLGQFELQVVSHACRPLAVTGTIGPWRPRCRKFRSA